MTLRKRGKLPAKFDLSVPHMSQMRSVFGLPSAPPTPASIDWMQGMDRDALGTLGNAPDPAEPNGELVGDCGIVGMYRFIQVEQFLTTGTFLGGIALYPCALQTYSEVSGWQPGNPDSDTGISLIDGLKHWMTTGIILPDGTRHKIVGFFQIDHRSDADLRQAVAECGGAYVGQDIPDAYDQSQPGDNWTVVGPPSGGHCTDIMAYDPSAYDMESWAMRFPETIAAKNAYMTESWAPVSPTWAKATGKTPFGMTLDQIDACMQNIKVN
jgi:hypothetical protein